MADLLLTQEVAGACDDVEAGPAGGLVDDEVAVKRGGVAAVRGCRSLCSLRGWRSVRSKARSSVVLLSPFTP
jgi:hypothetical protein